MAAWDFLKKQNGQAQNQEPIVNDDNATIKVIKDLKTHAFNQASECKAATFVLKTNISKLYYNKIIDDENFFKQEDERKNNLQKQLHDEESNLEKVEGEILEISNHKKEIEKEITDLKNDREKVNAGDKSVLSGIQPPDKIGYTVGIIILVFLTAYLFLFYTSAIYNSFVYDVKEASKASIIHNTSIATTIFNPNAIVDAYNKSIFTFLFILTSPMIFLGLGYLIHKFNETKKYLYTVLILTFTLFFDAVLAYAIVSEIYEAKYVTGMSGIDKPWEFNMIYSQVPFYIILAAGFVIYVVWGVVLSFVINGHNNLNPLRAALRILNNQIKDLQVKLKEITTKLSDANGRKTTIQATIKKHKTDLAHEKFNKENFEHRVAEFMSGWHNWIVQGLPYEKHVRQSEADSAKDEIIALLYQKNLIQNEESK